MAFLATEKGNEIPEPKHRCESPGVILAFPQWSVVQGPFPATAALAEGKLQLTMLDLHGHLALSKVQRVFEDLPIASFNHDVSSEVWDEVSPARANDDELQSFDRLNGTCLTSAKQSEINKGLHNVEFFRAHNIKAKLPLSLTSRYMEAAHEYEHLGQNCHRQH